MSEAGGRIAVVLKGYPRLSETFVAQEIQGLETRGLAMEIWSLRRPTDRILHPVHRAIRAPVRYLPEYLYQAPWRVIRALAWAVRQPGFRTAAAAFGRDLRRDPTPNRIRRFGQAAVLALELDPRIRHLHVQFLHTPASVTRYAALLSGRSWTFSAHAKDIWTIPDWEKREKLADARWGVTCTADGHANLAAAAPDPTCVSLLYHGLDLARFPHSDEIRIPRDGSDPGDPVRIVSVGRAVRKKGYDDLLAALAALPPDLHWRFAHVGDGSLLADLKAKADAAGLGSRAAFLGPKAQPDILTLLREADMFVLPAKEAADGDRDGLPNVLMEAASQGLALVTTRFAAIPEFVRDGMDGLLVPPGDWAALSNAINLLVRDPGRRAALGRSAEARLRTSFGAESGLDWLAGRLRAELDDVGTPRP